MLSCLQLLLAMPLLMKHDFTDDPGRESGRYPYNSNVDGLQLRHL